MTRKHDFKIVKYTLDILKEAGLSGAKPTATPMEQNQSPCPSYG